MVAFWELRFQYFKAFFLQESVTAISIELLVKSSGKYMTFCGTEGISFNPKKLEVGKNK